jgi:hypothetical protein
LHAQAYLYLYGYLARSPTASATSVGLQGKSHACVDNFYAPHSIVEMLMGIMVNTIS